MRYVIMADGKMTRWKDSVPKHLIKVNGEVLLERIIRLVRENDPSAEIIVTSHDSRYGAFGAKRYEPKNNVYEIDRFTYELIRDDVCFLYGDTYYMEDAMKTICGIKTDTLHFVGTDDAIVAVIAHDGDLMKKHITKIRNMHAEGKLPVCKGWQLYQSFEGLPFDKKTVGGDFTQIDGATQDFNELEDYVRFNESRSVK